MHATPPQAAVPSGPRAVVALAATALLLLLCIPTSARAAAIIAVGTYYISPNTPNQQIPIYVTGGTMVQGVDLNVQVADGGTAAGGTVNGPKITAVDLITGTIFATNNTGSRDPGSYPQLGLRETTTAAGSVAASGLLATITVDTTGFFVGQWSFSLGNTLNGATDFGGTPATITDGMLQTYVIVPEPASTCVALALPMLLRRRR